MSNTNKPLLDPRLEPHVVDRPLDESPDLEDPPCPCCGAKGTKDHQTSSTLVGWNRATGRDPNHYWNERECAACGLHYVREYCKGNVWYTLDSTSLLAGVPSCFEDYQHTCSHCGGAVKRDYIDKKTGQSARILTNEKRADGTWVSGQYPVFVCAGCGVKTELRDEEKP